MTDIDIIELPSHRWAEYRALRLHALSDAPQAFGSSYAESRGYPDDAWMRRLRRVEDGETLLLFAEADGVLIGMAGAVWGGADDAPGVAMVISVFVVAAHRGRGIGHRLIQAVLAALRQRADLHTACLAVNSQQTEAIRTYLRAGFMPGDTVRNLMGDGQEHDELFMEYTLCPS